MDTKTGEIIIAVVFWLLIIIFLISSAASFMNGRIGLGIFLILMPLVIYGLKVGYNYGYLCKYNKDDNYCSGSDMYNPITWDFYKF